MPYDRRAQLPTYRVRFEEHDGLTVVLRRPGLDGLLDLAKATKILRRSAREGWPELDVRNLRAWRLMCRAFAASLVAWDLRADGEPVPPTLDGVLSQDLTFVTDVVRGWQQALRGQSQAPIDAEEPDDDTADDEPPEWDPENPQLDEEWLAQLPATPDTATADPAPELAVSDA